MVSTSRKANDSVNSLQFWGILKAVTGKKYSIFTKLSPIRRAAVYAVLTLLPVLGFAQDTSGDVSEPVTQIDIMIFHPWNLAGDNDPEISGVSELEVLEYEQIIFDIVINEIRAGGFEVFQGAEWDSYFADSPRRDVFDLLPVDLARAADKDIALSLFYRIEPNRIFLMVKAHDIRGNKIVAGNVQIARSGLGLLNSMNALMTQIIPQIHDASGEIIYMKNNPGARIGTTAASVEFLSVDNDMILSMPGIGEIGVIQDGSAELPYQPLALGQTLTVQKELKGYYSESQSFVLSSVENEVALDPLYPMTRVATDFSYNFWYLYGAALGFRYYIEPDQSFVRIQNQIFANPPDPDLPPGARTIVHDEVLLEIGTYLFFGHESLFRLSYSLGFGVLVSPVLEEAVAADAFINLGGIHYELNFPRFAIFIRQDFRYALPIFENRLYDQGLDIGATGIPTTLGVMIKW